MTELKPCPFCGGEIICAEIACQQREFRIYCANGEGCVAEMSLSFDDAGIFGTTIDFAKAQAIMQELIEAWNRRAENE